MRLSAALLWGFLLLALTACGAIGEDYTLPAGDTLSGGQHLVVVEATLEEDSTVTGDLNITASRVYVDATIQGDLTVIAEDITLGEAAVIEGDMIVCLVRDGDLTQAEQALVWGNVRNNCANGTALPALPNLTQDRFAFCLTGHIALSMWVALVGALAALVAPKRLRRISTTAHTYRGLAFGLGGLTLLTLLAVTSLWAFSLQWVVPAVLAPLFVATWAVLGFGALLGGVGITQPLGVRLARWLHLDNETPIVTAILGAGSVAFLLLSFRLLPDLAFISAGLLAAMAAWGLGAVLLTRAGRIFYDDYHRRPLAKRTP